MNPRDAGSSFGRSVIGAAVGCAVLGYVTLALIRISTPIALNNVEPAIATQVQRLSVGLPIYAKPTVRFVSLVYTPCFYYASAIATRLMGERLAAMRAVSLIAALISMWCIYQIVVFESGSRAAGAVAVGLRAALGGDVGWLALGRVDTLMGCLVMLSLYRLRVARGASGLAVAGGLWALAVLTKQSALVMWVPVALWQVWADRRRGAWFAAGFAATLAVLGGYLEWRSGGWFSYFAVFVAAHQFGGSLFGSAQMVSATLVRTVPFASIVPVALLLPSIRARLEITDQTASFYVVTAAALLASTVGSSLLHDSTINVLLLPCGWLLVLLTICGARVVRLARREHQPDLERLAMIVCIAQFVAVAYVPERIADPEDASLAQPRLVEIVGDVTQPRHVRRFIASQFGPAYEHADGWAVEDLRRGGSAPVVRDFEESVRAAVCGATPDRPVILDADVAESGDRAPTLAELRCD